METRPVQQAAFHGFMEAHRAMLPTWLNVIPFKSEFAQGATKEDVLLVDVGGGNGSQCLELKKAFPKLEGRIILQDRAPVLESALEGDGMEKMAYDFFTEQPIKSTASTPHFPVAVLLIPEASRC